MTDIQNIWFLLDPGIFGPVSRLECLSISEWVTLLRLLTDVTLVDEDTNSILTHYANREIQGNVVMHVAPPDDQFLSVPGIPGVRSMGPGVCL